LAHFGRTVCLLGFQKHHQKRFTYNNLVAKVVKFVALVEQFVKEDEDKSGKLLERKGQNFGRKTAL